MKTTLRLTTLIGLVALSIGLVNLRVRADDGVTPQNAQLIYRIYIPGISKAAGIAATATPRQTATATPKTTAAPALTPTTRPSPSPTPGGPTATPLPPGTVDLKINSLEVTQGIQTDANSVPLVAGRTSVLRAYAQTTSSAATANVSLSIAASRDGVPLAGSPLVIGPRTVSPSPTRGTFDSSFNVTLPAVWLSGRVVLTATVDSAGTVNEIDETNNTANATLSFANVPPLDVMIVPIRYNHTPTAQTYPAPTVDSISASIMQIYPVPSVNIAWHAAVLFSGDLSGSNAWGTLLDQVTALRQSEIGTNSPRLYYALVPIQNTAGRWFNSGIAGIGWVGGNRASVGLDLGGTSGGFVAAHELGHNLGRNHAPCGGAAGADANFPYAGGSIGQIGLDVLLSRVWTPANPDNAKDVMSYCSPKWISDYTYVALFNALKSTTQAQSMSAPEFTSGILVRVDLPETSAPVIQPAYSLPSAPIDAPTASDYSIQLLDISNTVMISQAVTLLQSSADDKLASGEHSHAQQDTPPPNVRSIQTILPRPAQSVAKVRLLKAGTVIAERPMTALPQGQASIIANAQPDTTGLLRWGVPGRAALVQMSADDGATWATLAVDVTSGELQLDLASLPAGTRRFAVILADAIQ